ncbi:MAG: hypothetical protein ACOC4Y_00865 [bacterium]
MNTILEVLMERDGMTEAEATDLIAAAKEDMDARLAEGELPYEICYEWFGLEPDYIMDLI